MGTNPKPDHGGIADDELGTREGAGARVGVLSGVGTRAALDPLADHVIESIAALDTLLGPR